MNALRGVAVCILLSLAGCSGFEPAESAAGGGPAISDGGGVASDPDAGGAASDAGANVDAAGANRAEAGLDTSAAGGAACTEHADCPEEAICNVQDQCVAGCLPEDEPCDPADSERCCEHFHCCPVFHICVPNWWE